MDIGIGSNIYDFFLVLHILAAIIGFGAVQLNGVFASRARTLPPAHALAAMETNFWLSTKVAEWFILATAVFGFGLVGLSDKAIEMSATWVSLSIALYIVALGASHALLRPRVKQLLALQREIVDGPPSEGPPPQLERMKKLGHDVGAIAGGLNVALVVIVFLMVFKPA